ncbi:hypothetical protein Tco_0897814 [Tanacetum coccineum]
MHKNLALIAKYFKKLYKPTNNNLRTSSNTRNKNMDTTPRYKNENQTGQFGNQRTMTVARAKEIVGSPNAESQKGLKASRITRKRELWGKQAGASYMAKIQEVPTADSGTDSEPLEHVQYDIGYNVFANKIQHSGQSRIHKITNMCLETNSKAIKESKHNTAQELTECKSILAETSRTLGRSQSIQTIHMLAPKCPTFNGRPTFANPMYLKKAQYEKPCLYAIPHDQSDPANRLVPDREETLTLEEESRSKLNKDLVKPFDYTKLNSLYEIFKPPTQHYEIQFAQANEIRKKMWRKSFVKTKPNIFKNIDFLPVSKSISKSRQAYNVMTNNINHLKEIVDQAWVKHSNDRLHLRNPTAQDMEILVKTCLMPLALKTQNDSFAFVHELKQEMHADLKYVESLEDEIDELESDMVEFSNMYDMLLQECMYRIASSTIQIRAPQLTQTSRNTNPRMSISTGVAHRTNVSRPQPRSNQMKDKVLPNTSQVKFKKTEVEDHPRISRISNQTKSVTACNDSLNSRTSNVNVVCATCEKCVFNSNHDACVSKFLNDVNARTKKPNVVPISTRKPKIKTNKSIATPHKKTVASESTTTNSKSYYRML